VQERDFKGIWIPREIWLTSELTLLEKIFLVEIDSLDNDQNCYASNAYFADFFGISKGRCTQIIKSLEAKGFIQIQLIRDKNVIKKRVIKVVRKLNTPIAKTKQGYLENAEDNNTYLNNTDIGGKPPKRFKKPSLAQVTEYKNQNDYISEPQAFIDYHESRGWVVGRSPMKDWKSAFRRWETNQKKWSKENANKQSSSERRSAYASNLYDYSKATNFQ
jgi:hypothetical protein